MRATAPGSKGYAWSKSRRTTTELPAREPGRDKYYDDKASTLVVDVEQSPRRFVTSFSSEQLRLAQMRRPCRSELSTPVPWRIETEDVGPGTYGGTKLVTEQKNSSFFRSTTPQLSLFADQTTTRAFSRSRAEVLGPGSYEPATPRWTRSIDRQQTPFASTCAQRERITKKLTSDIDTPPVQVVNGAPCRNGFTWPKKPRVTQTVATRDPGTDRFYADDVRSISWSIASGSGLRVG